MYQHLSIDNGEVSLPSGKVVCVGRNYLDHIHELNNAIPDEPLLFMKPSTALCTMHQNIAIPSGQGECHNEVEVAILIGSQLSHADELEVQNGLWGVGIALDLTLRDKQTQLKEKGQPWEMAKAFDGSCPVSQFVPLDKIGDLNQLAFSLSVNGEIRQQGHTKMMMRSTLSLISYISHYFTLLPGDIVLTGTPAGVGPLRMGDQLELMLDDYFSVKTQVSNHG